MNDTNLLKTPNITLDEAKEIVMYLEAGMQEQADTKLLEIANRADASIYNEVGNLTRGLHDAIRSFAEDPRIKVIADVEFPDASERLKYIIQMTDKAATRTLDAVDACSPVAKKLTESVDALMPVWNRLMHGHIDRFEFVNLCHQLDELLTTTKNDATKVTELLNEILMAQDYQDLTGQMIQKVIGLVSEVEEKLIKFLVSMGSIPSDRSNNKSNASEVSAGIEAQGPALERQKESQAVASSQDEVDDLLASLGF